MSITNSTTRTETIISDSEIFQKQQLVESVFNRIYHDNMSDMPIINDKLEVTVIGMQQWQSLFLGIVVTPWFMNIILLPSDEENWDGLPELSKQTFAFPSGQYTFIIGRDKELGTYQMCSLFSPMFEFADNEAATDTATVAIYELMDIKNIEKTDIDSGQIERIWQGEEALPENIEGQFTDFGDRSYADNNANIDQEAGIETPLKTIKQNIQKPISRRDMLRGRFSTNTKAEHD